MSATGRPLARTGVGRLPAKGWLQARIRQARTLNRGMIRPIDLIWSAFALLMTGAMIAVPGQQTIPYHFIFVSFTLVYGYRLWSPKTTVVLLLLLTLVPGVLFVHVFLQGLISADELAEIPLMPLIVSGMAWHAQRSASAQRKVQELAALEGSRLERQQEFLRDTAHAIRTPVTIARGHIELIKLDSLSLQSESDADEVLHQLDRLNQMARRLLSIEALKTRNVPSTQRVDVGAIVAEVGRRWSNAVSRRWRVAVDVDEYAVVDELRLEEALDAMIENALRFTGPRDEIRISCHGETGGILIEVADSGAGIPPEDRDRVFERFFHRQPAGEEPGSGLGLALVAAVSEAFGGSVTATVAPEGGALVALRLPRV